MKFLKDKKQKNLFLFILIASIAGISLILAAVFIGVGAKDYSNEVNDAKHYFDIKNDWIQVKPYINTQSWTWKLPVDFQFPESIKDLQNLTGDALQSAYNQITSWEVVDAPLFAYGIFMLIISIITGVGTGLFGNSIFNKKYQEN